MPAKLSNLMSTWPKRGKGLSQWLSSALALLMASSAAASDLATVDKAQVSHALHFLGQLNRADPLEPAGSHGSLGVGAGAGAQVITPPTEVNPVLKSQLGSLFSGDNGVQPGNTPYSMARAWLLKGLPLPIDLGLTAARPLDIDGAGVTQVGAHVQWSIYEAMAMPAFAIRATAGKLFGIADTTVTTLSASAVLSYNLLRVLTIYGEIGAAQQQASITLRDEGGLALRLQNQPTFEAQVSESWIEPVKTVGLRVTVIPPFVALTMAGSQRPDGNRDYAAKLSIGM